MTLSRLELPPTNLFFLGFFVLATWWIDRTSDRPKRLFYNDCSGIQYQYSKIQTCFNRTWPVSINIDGNTALLIGESLWNNPSPRYRKQWINNNVIGVVLPSSLARSLALALIPSRWIMTKWCMSGGWRPSRSELVHLSSAEWPDRCRLGHSLRPFRTRDQRKGISGQAHWGEQGIRWVLSFFGVLCLPHTLFSSFPWMSWSYPSAVYF